MSGPEQFRAMWSRVRSHFGIIGLVGWSHLAMHAGWRGEDTRINKRGLYSARRGRIFAAPQVLMSVSDAADSLGSGIQPGSLATMS